jgi:uncharacterized secreted protein with C-terminal beta-propeller domain
MENDFVDIIGFEGVYKINRLGVVSNRGCTTKTPYIKPRGYIEHKLWGKDKKFHNKLLHRLLAEAFIPNPENKPTVDHIDRNTSNNDLSNLRWATHYEQHQNMTTTIHFETEDDRHKYQTQYKSEWRRNDKRKKRFIQAAQELRDIDI